MVERQPVSRKSTYFKRTHRVLKGSTETPKPNELPIKLFDRDSIGLKTKKEEHPTIRMPNIATTV